MKKWVKKSEKTVYDGYRHILRRTFELPDGKTAEFDVIKKNGSAVLAVTPDNKIICLKQFRPGPEEVLFELPGGEIGKDETPIEAARRELKEETGYDADIEDIGSYWRDAYITGEYHIFVGKNAHKISEQELEKTEFGELMLLSVDEFKEKLFAGLMTDTTLGYAGLLHLGLLS